MLFVYSYILYTIFAYIIFHRSTSARHYDDKGVQRGTMVYKNILADQGRKAGEYRVPKQGESGDLAPQSSLKSESAVIHGYRTMQHLGTNDPCSLCDGALLQCSCSSAGACDVARRPHRPAREDGDPGL